MRSGATGIAYETVEVNRRLPLLEPMSEIAGRMSVLVGGYYLAVKHSGGSGTLLGGVPGVLPGKVVVLGGGVAGVNAARMAQGLGADVTILEVDIERMRFLDITLHTAHTLYSSEAHLMDLLPDVDLLIGAVLVPGAQAPRLIRREMLRTMRPGAFLWISPSTRRMRGDVASDDPPGPGVCGGGESPITAWRTCRERMPARQRRRSPMPRRGLSNCWPTLVSRRPVAACPRCWGHQCHEQPRDAPSRCGSAWHAVPGPEGAAGIARKFGECGQRSSRFSSRRDAWGGFRTWVADRA